MSTATMLVQKQLTATRLEFMHAATPPALKLQSAANRGTPGRARKDAALQASQGSPQLLVLGGRKQVLLNSAACISLVSAAPTIRRRGKRTSSCANQAVKHQRVAG
jgi:hypothetical protein